MGYTLRRQKIQALWEKQGHKCFYCKVELPSPYKVADNEAGKVLPEKDPTFDHIVEKKNGGSFHIKNGVCACKSCNSVRGHMPFELFMISVRSPQTRDYFLNRRRKEHLKKGFKRTIKKERKKLYGKMLERKQKGVLSVVQLLCSRRMYRILFHEKTTINSIVDTLYYIWVGPYEYGGPGSLKRYWARQTKTIRGLFQQNYGSSRLQEDTEQIL